MIVTDMDGYRMYLTKTRLIEIDHNSNRAFFLYLEDLIGLKTAYNVLIYDIPPDNKASSICWPAGFEAYYSIPKRIIGCHMFSKKVFNQIRKATNALRKPKAKAATTSKKKKR